MRRSAEIIILFFVVLMVAAAIASGKEATPSAQSVSPREVKPPVTKKGVTPVQPLSFQVQSVNFLEMSNNNQRFLAVTIFFNKDIDPASVQQNVNIRLLKKDENNFWCDFSTQNNNVRILNRVITWAAGAPLENGYYVMHLRGTLKSTDGLFLDCDGDGHGEGGYLPAYESAIYQVNLPELELIERDGLEDIINNIRP